MKYFAAALTTMALFAGPSQAGQFGTGFAVSPQGFFVTCNHVIKNSHQIIVHGPNGPLAARVIAADAKNDIAILHVTGWKGRYLGLKSANSLEYAAKVTIAGFPDPTVMGRNPKVSKGIVNALSGVRDDPRFIQISAPVQPGNSGGPLVTESGQVVGIVAAGINSIDRMNRGGYVPQSVNYAVKTDFILDLLKQQGVDTPSFGTKTSGDARMVRRVMSSIALIEGIGAREISSLAPARSSHATTHPQHQTRNVSMAQANNGGPWIFEDSHSRKLMVSEVKKLSREVLWLARNEIYLRRGYIFTTERGRRFSQNFAGHYRPLTSSVELIQSQLNEAEIHNLRLIASFEENG